MSAPTLDGVTSSTVNVTYTAPTSLNGGAFVKYIVEQKLKSESAYTAVDAGSATTFSLTGLVAGSIYEVRVMAENAAGASAASAVLEATTTASGQTTTCTNDCSSQGTCTDSKCQCSRSCECSL
jgi:hypothetical protein